MLEPTSDVVDRGDGELETHCSCCCCWNERRIRMMLLLRCCRKRTTEWNGTDRNGMERCCCCRCRKRTDVVGNELILRCRKRTTNDVVALSEIGTERCCYCVVGSKSNYGRTMLLLLLRFCYFIVGRELVVITVGLGEQACVLQCFWIGRCRQILWQYEDRVNKVYCL